MQKGRRNTSQQSEFDPLNIKHWSQENRLVSILKQDLEYKQQGPSVPGAWGWENLEKSSLAAAAGLVLLCCRVLAVLANACLPPSSKCQIKLGEVDLMWRDCDWTTQLVRSRDRKAAKKGWSEYFGTWDWLVEKKKQTTTGRNTEKQRQTLSYEYKSSKENPEERIKYHSEINETSLNRLYWSWLLWWSLSISAEQSIMSQGLFLSLNVLF